MCRRCRDRSQNGYGRLGRATKQSGFVSRTMEKYFDGGYTLSENESMRHLAAMIDCENIPLEPAALAGTPGQLNYSQQKRVKTTSKKKA